MKPFTVSLLIIGLMTLLTHSSLKAAIIKPIPTLHENLQNYKISELVKLSATQFASLTGKKMNLSERISFAILKLKMKHDLKKDPGITLKDYYGQNNTKHWKRGWKRTLILIIGILFVLFILLVGAFSGFKGEH